MGAKKSPTEEAWKRAILNPQLNDAFWTARVYMFNCAPTNQDRIYLNKFETAAANEKRFVIKNISKSQTMFMIKQLGGEKKVKDDNLIIFEECQAFVKEKAEIPSNLMAMTIKYLMLKIKDEYLFIKRQRLYVKEGLQRESTTMIDVAEVRGSPVVQKSIPVETVKPKGKVKKGEEEVNDLLPEEGKKYNTLLRIRGEEWRDKVYVDDYPTDGPNLYIAITGFEDPFLCECLVKIGVIVTAVVQIRIDPIATQVPNELMSMSKRGETRQQNLKEITLKFWEDLQQQRIHGDSAQNLKHTAFLIFTPPYWSDCTLSGDPDIIYDEVCYYMYDLQDLSRQHFNYLDNLGIIKIPDATSTTYYMSAYSSNIKMLPLESTTIYSILDNMLNTISKKPNNKILSVPNFLTQVTSLGKEHAINDKRDTAQNIIKKIFHEIQITQKHYRPTFGEDYERYKGPLIIQHGDLYKKTTFHLSIPNLKHIVYNMLLEIPIHRLWNSFSRPDKEKQAKLNYHANLLISCFDDNNVTYSKLIRLLNILACRKVYEYRSSKTRHRIPIKSILDFKKLYLKRSILSEETPNIECKSTSNMANGKMSSINNIEEESLYETTTTSGGTEHVYYPFDFPDITEMITTEELNKNNNNYYITDDYNYFEDFSGINSFQIIQDMFLKFNCVDYKYCEVTDSIVLMFYNSHDCNGVQYDEWRHHLPTPICFQDYCDFVFEENYEWTKLQEKIYEDRMNFKKQSESSGIVDIIASTSCIDNHEIGVDMLIDGSLKHKEYYNNTSINSQSSDKLSKKSAIPSFGLESNKKKNKSPTSSTPKSTIRVSKDSIQESVDKYFSGYELGDRRVEVFGKDTYFYSKDGTRILISYYMLIPSNIEYVSLEVSLSKEQNIIQIHKALSDLIEPKESECHKSFFVSCKDNMLINVLKENPQQQQHSPSTLNRSLDEIAAPTVQHQYYHRLVVTWPNGLIIETVHEENNANISHIKQHYLNTLKELNEDMRCITRNGEVIIFKINNHIETLRTDGTKILITKCEKKAIIPDIDTDADSASQAYSNKSTMKSKTSKQTKSLKSQSSSPTKFATPFEYELNISEFEISDMCGNHHKFDKYYVKEFQKRLIRTLRDYNLSEIYYKTMDGTKVVIDKNSVQTVTFPDKTRIISMLSIEDDELCFNTSEENTQKNVWIKNSDTSCSPVTYSSTSEYVEEERFESFAEEENEVDIGFLVITLSYIVEHPNFATIRIDPDGSISIDSPNNTSVTIKEQNIDMKLNDSTRLLFDGVNLNMDCEFCNECNSKTSCVLKICNENETDNTGEWWMKMNDSFGKKITVDEEGVLQVTDDYKISKDSMKEESDTSSEKSCANCIKQSNFPNQRFFILHRDLSSSELIHHDTIEKYMNTYYEEPWYRVNTFPAFNDDRNIMSIIRPVHLNESEKWLMDSKLANPPYYKIIKHEEKKGFYHWMRPYGRFVSKSIIPDNVLPPRVPRAFILRTLEQFWEGKLENPMRGGRGLVQAILKYRQILENKTIHNFSSYNEDISYITVNNFVRWISQNLKKQLDEHMLVSLKPGITTKNLVLDIDSESVLMEEEDIFNGEMFEDRQMYGEELERVEKTSQNLRKYWRLRSEERREEEFNKYLLRQGDVPPYYTNILGGAIRYELITVADRVIEMLIKF